MGNFAYAFPIMFAMKYQELLDWLFVQFPSYQKVGDRAYKPGLEAMHAFAAELGDPQRRLRMVHVAGTHGKGSSGRRIMATIGAEIKLKLIL